MLSFLSPINSSLGETSKTTRSVHDVSCPQLWSICPPSIEITLQKLTATLGDVDSRVTLLPVKGRAVIWRNLWRVVHLGGMMGLYVCTQDLWVQVQPLPLTTRWLRINLLITLEPVPPCKLGVYPQSFSKHWLSAYHEPGAMQSYDDCCPSLLHRLVWESSDC